MATFIIRDRLTGRVKVDLSSRITKQLGIISTGNSAGSIVVPEFSGGSPYGHGFQILSLSPSICLVLLCLVIPCHGRLRQGRLVSSMGFINGAGYCQKSKRGGRY